MYSIEYEFLPNDTVYAVTDNNRVREGEILQVDIRIYEREDYLAEDLTYIILLEDGSASVRLPPDLVFATVEEALEKVRTNIENSVDDGQ